ncbi:ABC transporter ATP-binding protein [Salinirussus salinus]|jgi:ABC-2 type transport system ATP-binding protein|uniref:ABC transporter ATP-binding protein n=1 Tax=Salinirussus salinus TaxID=1198300 RepID=UPI0013581BC7|nr:ABC transporter ATP-binding protein [Salinirussus salinus]
MTAIRTESLTKRFGSLTAVDDLDLTVQEGEVFGFLGPNGAGKSTTIDVLLDFVRPTAGTATVLGRDAQTESTAVRERIGVLPEGFDLYDRLSGRAHVDLAVDLKDADDDPDAILERVGLSAEAGRRNAGGYSQGMRQRLALGMALVGEPDLLVLDEPTNGLDPNGAREMRAIVREEVDRGATVFFSSHILDQVQAVCDRVGIIDDGALVAVDTIDGLRAEVGTAATITLEVDALPTDLHLTELEGVSGVSFGESSVTATCTDPAAKVAVIDRVREAGATVRDITTSEASLEELFAAYTGERR